MIKKVALAAGLVALVGCSGQGETIPTPSPEPKPPTRAEQLTSAAREADPTTTTEAPAPATTTTAPEPPTTRVRASPAATVYLRVEATTETGAWAIPT